MLSRRTVTSCTSCCTQNQKEGLRKPKSGNSKPPDGLQGVAMAKGKSMPHSQIESGTNRPVSSHVLPCRSLESLTHRPVSLTCPHTWQRVGRSNVHFWPRSWTRRGQASRVLEAPAKGITQRRSCLHIRTVIPDQRSVGSPSAQRRFRELVSPHFKAQLPWL